MTAHIHVVSHTHWDREWYLTFEQYRARLVRLVDGVLDRMTRDERFTHFHLDGQSVVLEDYLEIRPERESEIRARVREGRLLIGPWYVMPDMFLVSGESLVRNLATGIRIAEGFGQAMRVGYMPDPFGHVAQMPQILAAFGLDGAILWRGFAGRRAEYLWEAPDGTRVTLLHLPPDGYCNGLRLPLVPLDEMGDAAALVIDYERDRSTSGELLLMVGVDHVEPHPALATLIDILNETDPGTARLSTLPDYVRAVNGSVTARGHALEVVAGELRGGEDYAHLLPGVLSARIYLKQANARVQRELERWAEPLAAFALLCGDPVPQGALRYAWRTLLQNHPHDSICGCSIDEVHEENVTRFARARQAAETAASQAASAIASRVPRAPADAIRALIVNTDLTPWSGVADATIDIPIEPEEAGREIDLGALEQPVTFFGAACHVAGITDAEGRALAFQVTKIEDAITYASSRYAPPVGLRVHRTSLAVEVSNVPAAGYAAIDIHIAEGAGTPFMVADAHSVIEHDLVRVEARHDGSVDVLDKRTGTRYDAVFAIEDVGDVGDEYNYSPPARDRRITNANAHRVRVRRLLAGPLVSALGVEYLLPVPVSADERRHARSDAIADVTVRFELRLCHGSPLVECIGTIDNTVRDHRMRMLWPTGASAVTSHRSDSAFAIVRRPAEKPATARPGVEVPVSSAPMQSFVDAGDARVGATVVTDGLVEFEVLPRLPGAPIAVTLVRAVGDLSRSDLSTRRGHAGPGLATPGAQCPGLREFRLAFVPRSTPPSAAELYATARAVLSAPRVMSPCGGSGAHPPRGSFVGAELEEGLVLSALKVADDRQSIVLRVFNASDTDRTFVVADRPAIAEVHRIDLAERRSGSLSAEGHGYRITLRPGRIETLELAVRSDERPIA